MYTLTIYWIDGIEEEDYSSFDDLISGVELRYKIAIRDNEIIKSFKYEKI